ncbi:MAG: hypothetical protein MPN21_27860 [Thermoanaerobaculia bacterium]|nr:hypothetical protein [Thermoanaerobaculia bacterium]
MANPKELEAQHAAEQARYHRHRSGQLFIKHRKYRDQSALQRARDEMAKAQEWENRALQLRNEAKAERHQAKGKQQTVAPTKQAQQRGRDTSPAGETDWSARRAWIKPGSVAKGDAQLQLQEANHGGLMAALASYAFRSVTDRQERSFEGAKLVGKAVTAPAKALAKTGQAVARTGKHILDAASRYGQKQAMVQRATASPGRIPKQSPSKQALKRQKARHNPQVPKRGRAPER